MSRSYAYRCNNGHHFDAFLGHPQPTIPCREPGCKATATRASADRQARPRTGVEKDNRRNPFTRHAYRCTLCDHFDDDILVNTRDVPEDSEILTSQDCPVCKADKTFKPATIPEVATFFNRKHPTGYFDHGLGMHIEDRAHRKKVMAEMGVEEIGGDSTLTIAAEARRMDDANRRVEREYDETVQQARRDDRYRRAEAMLSEQAKERVKTEAAMASTDTGSAALID